MLLNKLLDDNRSAIILHNILHLSLKNDMPSGKLVSPTLATLYLPIFTLNHTAATLLPLLRLYALAILLLAALLRLRCILVSGRNASTVQHLTINVQRLT